MLNLSSHYAHISFGGWTVKNPDEYPTFQGVAAAIQQYDSYGPVVGEDTFELTIKPSPFPGNRFSLMHGETSIVGDLQPDSPQSDAMRELIEKRVAEYIARQDQ